MTTPKPVLGFIFKLQKKNMLPSQRKILCTTIISIWLLSVTSCKKSSPNQSNNVLGLPVVETLSVESTGFNSLTINAVVTDEGTSLVLERGFVWTSDPNKPPPDLNSKSIKIGGGIGIFKFPLDSSFKNGESYYIRA